MGRQRQEAERGAGTEISTSSQSPPGSHRSSLGGSSGPDNEDREADTGEKIHRERVHATERHTQCGQSPTTAKDERHFSLSASHIRTATGVPCVPQGHTERSETQCPQYIYTASSRSLLPVPLGTGKVPLTAATANAVSPTTERFKHVSPFHLHHNPMRQIILPRFTNEETHSEILRCLFKPHRRSVAELGFGHKSV